MEAGSTYHRGKWDPREHEDGLPFREADFESAVERGELSIDYQPIVSVRSGAVVGAEAAISWHHPRWRVVRQSELYAAAECLGVAARVGEYVITEVCRQLGHWNKHGCGASGVSMRFSGAGLWAESMSEHLAREIEKFDVPAAQLTLEIPEMPAPEESPPLQDCLKHLRQKGFGIVLSEFGAHHTAMSTLMVLPVTGVKFGDSFASRLPSSATAEAILSSVSRLTHDLGLTLTVAGVNSTSQLEFLRRYSNIELQGDALFKQMSAQALHEYMGAHATSPRYRCDPSACRRAGMFSVAATW
ncbi:EAL domain-containing protein [Burkholderia sp. MSMB1078WGS]|uniref:EAL domain-containing protein n=1 Tax=Burkholderia sp. MSMB1078WGS TaxID=1637900 RepID=UPI0009EA641D|nr:EAL domain-containing protein [Burkholderia sp. MSMB1078WGS]